jgi:hypothetical protein|tara:strand:+ start:838 stop:1035 length:198 start_codon:yes stop_codon:yes gene_type:complete
MLISVIITLIFFVVVAISSVILHDKIIVTTPKIPETESEEKCKRIKERYEWLSEQFSRSKSYGNT